MAAAPISIVIPAFNQLEFCRQCVHSILLHTQLAYRLILVDNGSTDGVSEFFDSVPGAVVAHAGRNLGFAGGVNLGLEYASGHVVLLNSDTIVPRGWLERLETALLNSPDIGIVGPMSNCVSGSQLIPDLNFNGVDEINDYAESLYVRRRGVLRDVARLVGFCMLIREETLEKVGRFDETFGVGNFEDDDYCLRTLRAGYRLCVAEDCFVFHYGGRTFSGMGLVDEAWKTLISENERRFLAKWDLEPDERSDAAQQSRQYQRQAHEALVAGRNVEALRLLKQAIETAPQVERNYNDLGTILWEMGERERAYAQFARALQLNPAYAEARENLREAAWVLHRETEAEALLRDLPEK